MFLAIPNQRASTRLLEQVKWRPIEYFGELRCERWIRQPSRPLRTRGWPVTNTHQPPSLAPLMEESGDIMSHVHASFRPIPCDQRACANRSTILSRHPSFRYSDVGRSPIDYPNIAINVSSPRTNSLQVAANVSHPP